VVEGGGVCLMLVLKYGCMDMDVFEAEELDMPSSL
jgi:hypothetical protein